MVFALLVLQRLCKTMYTLNTPHYVIIVTSIFWPKLAKPSLVPSSTSRWELFGEQSQISIPKFYLSCHIYTCIILYVNFTGIIGKVSIWKDVYPCYTQSAQLKRCK